MNSTRVTTLKAWVMVKDDRVIWALFFFFLESNFTIATFVGSFEM